MQEGAEASPKNSMRTKSFYEQVIDRVKERKESGDPVEFGPGCITYSLSDIQQSKPLSFGFQSLQGKKYENKFFDDFSTEKHSHYPEIKTLAEKYVDKFPQLYEDGTGFYFYSENPGSGKTLLACIIANEIHRRYNVPSQVYTFSELFDLYKESYDNPDISEFRILNVIRTVPLLILDEISFEENVTKWVKDQVFKAIDARYKSGKPTIFTSNVHVDELPYHSRVASRINEICVFQEFPNYDHRIDEGEKKQSLLLRKIME